MDVGVLVDPAAEAAGAARLETPAGSSLDDVAAALGALLEADAAWERVVLVVGGTVVGATSRTYARTVLGGQGTRDPGDEVRAAALGESTHFQLVTFGCATCARRTYTAYYDERYRPVCEVAAHGPMDVADGR